MQRVSSGYTIIEVLIFLAVSGFLLVVSITFLSGREGHARFSTSMRDMQSKMQDWLNDTPSGFAGGQSGTNNGDIFCRVVGTKLQIKDTGTPPDSPDCIFLGKAIQFTDSTTSHNAGQESKVYAYSVFGRRTLIDATGSERLVANIPEASPTPAVPIPSVSGSNKVNLTDTYTLGGVTKVLSVTSQAINSSGGIINGHSHLAGFFLSFNQLSANRNGSQDLKSYLFNLPNNEDPGTTSSTVDDCIGLSGSCAKTPNSLSDDLWPQAMASWQICFGNDGNSDTAVLTIGTSNGFGASTRLDFKACS
jgi:hypothetical protein